VRFVFKLIKISNVNITTITLGMMETLLGKFSRKKLLGIPFLLSLLCETGDNDLFTLLLDWLRFWRQIRLWLPDLDF